MFVSGKNNMIGGFTKLPENMRQTACKSYPIDSDEKAISLFKKNIASLESPDKTSELDHHQAARLQAQKEIVFMLVPGIDCSKIQ